MIDPAIVKRYSAAFLQAAKTQHLVQRLYTESQTLSELLRAHPKILAVLEAPHINASRKIELIERLFKSRLTPLLLYLIEILAQKYRSEYIDEILDEYRKMVDEERGIYEASITSARELPFLEKLQVKTALEKFTGHKLNIVHRVDPNIIGGLIFKYQDLYIDSSIRGQLDLLRKRLESADVIK